MSWLKSTPVIEVDRFLKNQLVLAISKLARNSRIIYPMDEKYEFQVFDPSKFEKIEKKARRLNKILEEKEAVAPKKLFLKKRNGNLRMRRNHHLKKAIIK